MPNRRVHRLQSIDYSRAFTIIEVLVVVAIIGILSGLSIFGIQDARQNGRDSVRKANLQLISSALELYKLDCNHYPKASDFVVGQPLKGDGTNSRCKTTNTYIASIPADPIAPSRYYVYSASANNKTYELCASLEKGTGNTVTCGGSSICGTKLSQNLPDFKIEKQDVLANLLPGNQNIDFPLAPNGPYINAVPNCGGKPDGTFCYQNDYLPWTYPIWCSNKTPAPGSGFCGDPSKNYSSPPYCGQLVQSTCKSGACVPPPSSKSWTIKVHPLCPDGSPNSSGNISVKYIGYPGCTDASTGNAILPSSYDQLAPGIHTITINTGSINSLFLLQDASVGVWVDANQASPNNSNDTPNPPFPPMSPFPNPNMRLVWGLGSYQHSEVAWYPALLPEGTYDLNFQVPASWCGGATPTPTPTPSATPTPTPTVVPPWTSTPTPQPAVCNYKITSP